MTLVDEVAPPIGVAPSADTVGETAPARRHWIDKWEPEDERFWADGGERIARRNLICSILTEHVGFCVWSMWSAFVLFLGPEYGLLPAQKFLLTALPAAIGAVIRIPYTLAVARFGGRNWTVVSSLLLLIPTVATAIALKPGVSYSTMLMLAALAGVGGGNFSSSMANIDAFYPQRLKGWALGLNAGGGNIGVACVQLVGLAVLAIFGAGHPRLILVVYIPLVVISATVASRFMDNLGGMVNDQGAMRQVLKVPHTWVLCTLYIGTFGTFIGFGFAFGQVLQVQFASTFDTPIKAAYLTFLGPLLGSLVRPIGGRLADRHGGSLVTLSVFVAMTVGATAVLAASRAESLPLFLVGFICLFVLSGIGNGSTYKMIPAVFGSRAQQAIQAGADAEAATWTARRMSRALIGIAGAVGAFGGVLVNLAFRQAFLNSKAGDVAYMSFIAVYLGCAALTWVAFRRRGGLTNV